MIDPTIPESALDKIKKLHAHAESAKAIGSIAEAEAFAAKVAALLLQYNLDLQDIAVEERPDDEIIKEMFDPVDHGLDFKRTRVQWQESLAAALAKSNFCRIMVGRGQNAFAFVGAKHNIEVVSWLYATLVRDLTNVADKEYVKFFYACRAEGDVTKARGYRASWLTGAVLAIAGRLKKFRAGLEEDKQTMSLILAIDVKLDNWLDTNAVGTVDSSLSYKNTHGARKGYAYGQTVSLTDRPLPARQGAPIRSLISGRTEAQAAADAKLAELWSPSLERLGLKPSLRSVGVAFNAKTKRFSATAAVETATERFGVKPDGFTFYNGVLYLSSTEVKLAERWETLHSTSDA